MQETAERVELRRCPYLGLAWDPASTALYSSPDHRCYVTGKSRAVPLAFQATTCLGPYTTCSHYVDSAAASQPEQRDGSSLRRLAAFAGLALLGFAAGLLLGVLRNAV